jgi:hypothetical protein
MAVKCLTTFPGIKRLLELLVNPTVWEDPKALQSLVLETTESVRLGTTVKIHVGETISLSNTAMTVEKAQQLPQASTSLFL